MKYCAAQLQLCFDMRCRMEFFGEEKKKKGSSFSTRGPGEGCRGTHLYTTVGSFKTETKLLAFGAQNKYMCFALVEAKFHVLFQQSSPGLCTLHPN